MTEPAFQDLIPHNHCYGCGPLNQQGLQIKSHWDGEDEAVCHYQPLTHHAAGPTHVLNGGIIATLIDCHGICTAVADGYRQEDREIGSPPDLWFATASLEVRYLRPAPLAAEVEIRARIVAREERKTHLDCTLTSAGKVRAEGTVVAVRVPASWRDAG
ncbi:MAG: PaaI family thioesterase [Acidobacteriota bacterium]